MLTGRTSNRVRFGSPVRELLSFRRALRAIVLATLVAALLAAAPPAHAADDCASPDVMGSFPYDHAQDTRLATVDPSDPFLPCGAGGQQARSVWYSLVAPFTGTLEIDTVGSNYDTVVAVLEGVCGSLSTLPGGCNDDFFGLQSYVSVNVTQGQAYLVEITSFHLDPGGDLIVHAEFTPDCGGGVAGPDSVCDDDNVCNGAETCDSVTGCLPGTPLVCEDEDLCTDDGCHAISGCTFDFDPGNAPICEAMCPLTADLTCQISGKAKIDFNDSKPGFEKMKLQWKKVEAATAPVDLGDPVGGDTSIGLCVYDDANDLVREYLVDRASALCAGKPCWKSVGDKGFSYKDSAADSDGISALLFKAGAAGKGKFQAKGLNKASKDLLSLPTGSASALILQTSPTLQMRSSSGLCLSAAITDVKKDEGDRYLGLRK